MVAAFVVIDEGMVTRKVPLVAREVPPVRVPAAKWVTEAGWALRVPPLASSVPWLVRAPLGRSWRNWPGASADTLPWTTTLAPEPPPQVSLKPMTAPDVVVLFALPPRTVTPGPTVRVMPL